MRTRTNEQQLRRFLLAVTAAVCIGTILELSLVEHMETAIQLLPFVLASLGLVVALTALYAPGRRVLLTLRLVMAGVAMGSIYGIYEHFQHNLAFELEVNPGATAGEVFWDALGGATPFLAPGILALAAVLAVGATYRHPVLQASNSTVESLQD